MQLKKLRVSRGDLSKHLDQCISTCQSRHFLRIADARVPQTSYFHVVSPALKGFHNTKAHVFSEDRRLCNPCGVALRFRHQPRVRSLRSRPWAALYNAFSVKGLRHVMFDDLTWNYRTWAQTLLQSTWGKLVFA